MPAHRVHLAHAAGADAADGLRAGLHLGPAGVGHGVRDDPARPCGRANSEPQHLSIIRAPPHMPEAAFSPAPHHFPGGGIFQFTCAAVGLPAAAHSAPLLKKVPTGTVQLPSCRGLGDGVFTRYHLKALSLGPPGGFLATGGPQGF